MKKINPCFGFTLAEVMIVLAIIGILAAILLPASRNAIPNEDIVKFKKAHKALYSAVQELVNSDKYFLNGDLSVKSDGSCMSSEYFLNSFADVLKHEKIVSFDGGSDNWDCVPGMTYDFITDEQFNKFKDELDNTDSEDYGPSTTIVKASSSGAGPINLFDDVWVIVTPDNLTDFLIATIYTGYDFGTGVAVAKHSTIFRRRLAGLIKGEPILYFSYAIRHDGKIISSKHVDEWLEKSAQED